MIQISLLNFRFKLPWLCFGRNGSDIRSAAVLFRVPRVAEKNSSLQTPRSHFQSVSAIITSFLFYNHPTPHFVLAMNNIGLIYCNSGQVVKARPFLQDAFDICKRSLPRGHPQTCAGKFDTAFLTTISF